MRNCGENVFDGIPARPEEATFWMDFIASNDFAAGSVRGMIFDLRRFAAWFAKTNNEPFSSARLTTSDLSGFREAMRRQDFAVATVNRNLVTIRRYLDHLVQKGHLDINPAKAVKELRRQQLAPKGLERTEVRRLLREIELRGDVKADAIFSTLLWTGCRVSELTGLRLGDLSLSERSGSAVVHGKGNKQRSVPLPLPARRALQAYLDTRPPVSSDKVFIGERGPLTDRGIRALCDKYSGIIGITLYPHLLRHTFAHQFLAHSNNDLVALAQLLGHSNINTSAIYTRRTKADLADAADNMTY